MKEVIAIDMMYKGHSHRDIPVCILNETTGVGDIVQGLANEITEPMELNAIAGIKRYYYKGNSDELKLVLVRGCSFNNASVESTNKGIGK